MMDWPAAPLCVWRMPSCFWRNCLWSSALTRRHPCDLLLGGINSSPHPVLAAVAALEERTDNRELPPCTPPPPPSFFPMWPISSRPHLLTISIHVCITVLPSWHGSHVFNLCSSCSPLKPVFSSLCCVISLLFHPAMSEQPRPPLEWWLAPSTTSWGTGTTECLLAPSMSSRRCVCV